MKRVRKSTTQNGYNFNYSNPIWVKMRNAAINKQPFCRICKNTFNLQGDHIYTHQYDVKKFLDYENVQVLCRECHSHKTGDDNSLFFIKTGSYDLFINNEKDSNYPNYIKMFKNNIGFADKYILNESRFNPIKNEIPAKNLTPAELQHIITIYIKHFNYLPATISTNSLPAKWVDYISTWINYISANYKKLPPQTTIYQTNKPNKIINKKTTINKNIKKYLQK